MESFVEKVYATFWKTFQSPGKLLILFFLLASCSHRIPHEFKRYDRSEWSHWSDPDKDCQNTRQEILITRSKTKVKLNKKSCTVISGQWSDYYFPEEHTLAKNVDIDHLIPLKHAHEVGGANWTQKEKERFANDPENLVITNKSYNRKKGAKTIAEWLPIHRDRTCVYLKDWVRIKKKYHLILKEEEFESIKLSGCTDK
jgi:hypothetical protein